METHATPDLGRRLLRLAYNMWWSWQRELDDVFRDIDEALWRHVNHNPIAFLQDVHPELLHSKGQQADLIAKVIRAERSLDEYLRSDRHWASWNAPGFGASPVAYFSPEFALHDSMPVFSGGLGVLAGDHLKSCSDLGLSTCGVTLLYRQGYFVQEIDAQGRQRERYRDLDTDRAAVTKVMGPDGTQLTVELPVDGTSLQVRIWQLPVGRCRLYFLDPVQSSTGPVTEPLRLYGGDRRMRLLQELILGVGGYRALRALGISPGVLHLNEGHSGFAVLEAIACGMEDSGRSFEEVSAEVRDTVVFTTHTPVDAGHDYFDPELLLRHLQPLRTRLELSEKQLLGLGRVNPDDASEQFCMTILGLKLCRSANAVSSLHGHVSRRMWHKLWPERTQSEIPIGHITNGAHVDTWVANELGQLFRDVLGTDWQTHLSLAERWRRIQGVDPSELWSLKLALKRRLFQFVGRRHQARADREGSQTPEPRLRTARLTIGFARRFALYKRALLLFSDRDRALRLLTDPERPIQLIVAGKAHPADEPAQDVLQKLHELSTEPELRDHLVILEKHDMNVSRHLLEGCDLWLNAPRRPLEACGTSGMKAVFNCALNCSILDGWWDEAYDGRNGFAFGGGRVHVDAAVQDQRDADDLLRVLEEEVVPTYYDRDEHGVPRRWIDMIVHALSTLAWRYNSDRMVMDYARNAYLPTARKATSVLL